MLHFGLVSTDIDTLQCNSIQHQRIKRMHVCRFEPGFVVYAFDA